MADTITLPVRIQRRRTAGWRMPAGAISIGRGTRWGNPFQVGSPIIDTHLNGLVLNHRPVVRAGFVEDRQHAVELHWAWLHLSAPYTPETIRNELRGATLACWCPEDGLPCHGDSLILIANEEVLTRPWDD